MMGNVGMCVVVGEFVKGYMMFDEVMCDVCLVFEFMCVVMDEIESLWWDFDVENFGIKFWVEDDDGVFIIKVVIFFLVVVLGVCGLSLVLLLVFDVDVGLLCDYINVVAFFMVAASFALNIEKWKNCERVVLMCDVLGVLYVFLMVNGSGVVGE